jgi:RNA polymerase sigma-70 factor (ECF subfamily)
MHVEQELIERILKGDLRAFQDLVTRYQRLVMHMVGRIIVHPQDQEDICQEVFLQVYKKMATYNFESKFSTWIATIAYHTAINYLKKRKLYTSYQVLEETDAAHLPEVQPDSETALYEQDLKQLIHTKIQQLPLSYRTVLTMYHLQEFSYPEIEKITGMPEGTVKNYLFRARKLLKQALSVYQGKELLP